MPARRPTKTARLQGRELLQRLRPRFPALFPKALEDLKPWAVGEGTRMRQTLAGDGETVSSQVWHAAINLWFHGDLKRRVAYLKCLTQGAPRYDLHGNVSGMVSQAEAVQAATELAEREEKLAKLKAARHAAAKRAKAKAAELETRTT